MARPKSNPKPKLGELSDAILASELSHRSSALLSPPYRVQSHHLVQWIDINAYAAQVAGELWEHRSIGDVCKAFSVVHTQWIALMRSVTNLNDQGRYGPAAGLIRTIYERTDLIAYLCEFPDQASEWSQATRMPPTDRPHAAARKKYAWSKVRKKLRETGWNSTSNKAIRELNNAVHPSEWGLRFYALRRVPGMEMDNVIGISPMVLFDLPTAFWIGRLLHNLSPLPVLSLLGALEKNKIRRSAWRSLRTRYDDLLEVWNTYSGVNEKFATMMAESERRIIAGEDFAQVRADIEAELGWIVEGQ